MKKEELQKIKDISCNFAEWLDDHTIELGFGKRLIVEKNDDVEYDYKELFDYYVHKVLCNIIIDDISKN